MSNKVTVEILFQPNRSLTLDDPGVEGNVFELTRDQYWGILITALVLFGDNPDVIQITEIRNPNTSRERRIPVRLGYLSNALGTYILAYDSVYRRNRPQSSWNEYMHSFQRHIPQNLPQDTSDYTGHLIGKGEALIKFTSLDFLHGMLTVFSWFNLNPNDYFFDLYHNGVPMTL